MLQQLGNGQVAVFHELLGQQRIFFVEFLQFTHRDSLQHGFGLAFGAGLIFTDFNFALNRRGIHAVAVNGDRLHRGDLHRNILAHFGHVHPVGIAQSDEYAQFAVGVNVRNHLVGGRVFVGDHFDLLANPPDQFHDVFLSATAIRHLKRQQGVFIRRILDNCGVQQGLGQIFKIRYF